METFEGTLAPMGDGLHLTAQVGCGEMADECDQGFEAHLKNEGGSWRGEVTPTGGQAGWWLAGATFVLDDATGYGGATYGRGGPVE
jgi:hypothetical protein